jgi:DsbE subfamily thiol:disulfide oxidoreductase
MNAATGRLAIVALLIAVAALVWHFTPVEETPRLDPSALLGKPAAPIADYRGHVTLVNFFASWCVPCRAEQPLLAELSPHVTVIGLAYKDTPGAVAAYLASQGNPYARTIADPHGDTAAAFGVSGVPDSFLVDRHGIIRYRVAGPLTPSHLRDIEQLAAKLARAPDDSAAAAGL